MAKIRVHELAKELQMENKALVDAVREVGIEVKSHSSSLSDEEVSLIKGHLEGTKSLVVEEQRIKSTVIRRRKKIVEVVPEPKPVAAATLPPVEAISEPPLPESPLPVEAKAPAEPGPIEPADQEIPPAVEAGQGGGNGRPRHRRSRPSWLNP